MDVKFFLSSDVNLDVRVKVCSLFGLRRSKSELFLQRTDPGYSPSLHSSEFELFVSAQLFDFGSHLGVPLRTSFHCFTDSVDWNEWLIFPLKFKDISVHTVLVFTVWDVASDQNGRALPIGGSTVPLFDENGRLMTGSLRLHLWRDKEGDPDRQSSTVYKVEETEGLYALEETLAALGSQKIPHSLWLDKLLYKTVEKESLYEQPGSSQDHLELTIEFPPYKFPVVFHQRYCIESSPANQKDEQKETIDSLVFEDPEYERENPIEDKYYCLARSGRENGITGKALKPNLKERDKLNAIISSPDKQLSGEDKDLLWRFRYTLLDDPKALTKFLRCVHWNDVEEANEALHLMDQWKDIGISDALELLTPFFENQGVREKAVQKLVSAPDGDLRMFLLQLVQAIRFENGYPSPLSKFLISRCSTNLELANFLYWYVKVEEESVRYGNTYTELKEDFLAHLGTTENAQWIDTVLLRQSLLISDLLELSRESKIGKKKVKQKIEHMRELLTENGELNRLTSYSPSIPAPARPSANLTGILPQECSMFKSALVPLLLTFKTTDKSDDRYKVIFKSGDDLRQDQVIVQMIIFLDQMLKKVNLDLKLTPYRVLATSSNDGFVEFVPNCYTLNHILSQYENDIRKFFGTYWSKPSDLQTVIDTFIKSSAGYSVITYILGIGDRHLDNLLLDKTGHLFHIDFGYIFGRDPKPFPAKMRVVKEMIVAMGGFDSNGYAQFLSYSCQAFNIFRKNANLILNLLNLMSDSGIEDFQGDVQKTLFKVQEKFRLDLSDEDAEKYLVQIINESVSAFFPQVLEQFHKIATEWR